MNETTAKASGGGRLLRLRPEDNVAVATVEFPAGASIQLDHTTITLRDAVPLGHKVAVASIRAGAKIIKYGCPIGSATRPIAAGELVHTHNMKSDYLPTFLRG
jgi:hypothetical protein